VTLYEQWKQPNGAANQQFTGSDNYFVPVVSPSLGASGLVTDGVIVAVIAAAVILYRKRAQKKVQRPNGQGKGKK
jgi:hypothetical protein